MPRSLPDQYAWMVPGTEVRTVSRPLAMESGVDPVISKDPIWEPFWNKTAIVLADTYAPDEHDGCWYVALGFHGCSRWCVYCDWIIPVSLSPKDLAEWIKKERHAY